MTAHDAMLARAREFIGRRAEFREDRLERALATLLTTVATEAAEAARVEEREAITAAIRRMWGTAFEREHNETIASWVDSECYRPRSGK